MDYENFIASNSSRLSSPTCEDLGLPRDLTGEFERAHTEFERSHHGILPEGAVFSVHGIKYDARNPNNPFSPYCQIPLPNPFGSYGYEFEPAFIRKRNERERERVRCVNDGYSRLREHLPIENKEKRISKVETLRNAIKYIRYLQTLLTDIDKEDESKIGTRKRKLSARDAGDSNGEEANNNDVKRKSAKLTLDDEENCLEL